VCREAWSAVFVVLFGSSCYYANIQECGMTCTVYATALSGWTSGFNGVNTTSRPLAAALAS
jgi:hypothetical protein